MLQQKVFHRTGFKFSNFKIEINELCLTIIIFHI